MSTFFPLTDEQRSAVVASGGSVIVSAAAGSGKTTVLAERCAYLVCDAPENARCDVNKLLVLTFTDAAAAEMRSRIIEAIRKRADADPGNHRLAEQILLADSAQISTIHSFCLWIIRRWFDVAAIDPMVSVLDADEAVALKRQILEDLCERLYARDASPGALLGEDQLSAGSQQPGIEFTRTAKSFSEFVDAYGLENDRDIKALVLRLHEFVRSLPNGDDWLTSAVDSLSTRPEWVFEALASELRMELSRQSDHAEIAIEALSSLGTHGQDHVAQLTSHLQSLRKWNDRLTQTGSARNALDQLQPEIRDYTFQRLKPAPRGLGPEDKACRNEASKFVEEAKRLFESRVQERFGSFTCREWLDGMEKTAPYVATLVKLVRGFSSEYAAQKRLKNVLDFGDFEQIAHQIVCGGTEQNENVAAQLRDRFDHVLVDEFQDINPIQKSLIEAVSRERDANRAANLFAVGDVKQSIYRFRLAEPDIFLERMTRFRSEEKKRGEVLLLRGNFRSDPVIIEAVNVCFRQLMSGAHGGLKYDDDAELRVPRNRISATQHVPVEVHLLESAMTGNDPDSDAEPDAGADSEAATPGADLSALRTRAGSNPVLWDPIEREAFLIARRIRELTRGSNSNDVPVRFGDVAILLRTTKLNAARVASMLTSLGIPNYAEVGGSLMETLEARDVMAALHVLDNAQQDIPLTGILRSGIFGDKFSEDELVRIRAINRDAPLHAAVRQYAFQPDRNELADRLAGLFRRIDGLRDLASRRPLAEVVWKVLHDYGYSAYVCGLPNGVQRRANLTKIHDLSRGFAAFRKQGLHRFLRMLEQLQDGNQDISVAPAVGPEGNVVRIMSTHHAKGMEFPVVFVAGLGGQFNLGDGRGRMLFERKARIGFRALDRQNMLEYPTAIHLLAANEVQKCARDEELRILYVAMTRAKQRLILTGSSRWSQAVAGAPTPDTILSDLKIQSAKGPLDWLIPVLHHAPPGVVQGLGEPEAPNPLFAVKLHRTIDMQSWSLRAEDDKDLESMKSLVSTLDPLPPAEPVSELDTEVIATLHRSRDIYAHLSATSVQATVAASEIADRVHGKRRFAPHPSEHDRTQMSIGADRARLRGEITHRFLQHLDFGVAVNEAGVVQELYEMVARRVITEEESEFVSVDALAWFVGTELASRIRRSGPGYHRELRFVSSQPLSMMDPHVTTDPDDRVMIRGIVDGVLVEDHTCEVLDFKTDVLTESELEARFEKYRLQVEAYARAVEQLWQRPVKSGWLVFLSARRVMEIPLGARVSAE